LEDLKARIEARIAELEKNKAELIQAANRELVGYNTAIAELKKLVEAGPEAGQAQGDDAGQLPEAEAGEQPAQA
jgi:hypothetical protein